MNRSNGQNVEEQEHNREDFLLLWILWEAQEDKVHYIVPWLHLIWLEAIYLQNKGEHF